MSRPKKPTKKQCELLVRLASHGWDVVYGHEVRFANASSLLHCEIDWEAGDPEHGDLRKVARLTEEGAAFIEQETGQTLTKMPDGSWEFTT